GGVWKSDDYGRTWTPIFDDQPTGSIGAIAVAPSDPRTIYVGSGEGLQRPDLSVGDGIYKSADGGATWRHLGLRDGQQIPAIVVDPRDPNRVFAAVLGHPYGPNAERGVFRSSDGGRAGEEGALNRRENRRRGRRARPREPTDGVGRAVGRAPGAVGDRQPGDAYGPDGGGGGVRSGGRGRGVGEGALHRREYRRRGRRARPRESTDGVRRAVGRAPGAVGDRQLVDAVGQERPLQVHGQRDHVAAAHRGPAGR